MHAFLKQLGLFLLPIVAMFLFPVFVFITTREAAIPSAIVSAQRGASSDVLYKSAYSDMTRAYKIEATKVRSPEIVALGTSRTMQLRSEFFKEPEVFYNAAGMRNAADLPIFIHALPEDSPLATLIVGVDSFFLTEGGPEVQVETIHSSFDLWREFFARGWRSIYSDYWREKFSLRGLLATRHTESIGLAARVEKSGFRPDGSYAYGPKIDERDRLEVLNREIEAGVSRIALGGRGFESGGEVSEDKRRQLELFLAECRRRGIHVVGFLPPYAQEIYDTSRAMPDKYGELARAMPSIVESLFAEYGYRVYNTASLRSLGSSNKELIDSGHGSEKVYARLLLRLASEDEILKQQVNIEALSIWLRGGSDTEIVPVD